MMAKKKLAKPAETQKRERGPIVCEPDSPEAKRIEETHGFNAAAKARADRKKVADEDRNPGTTGSDKGDKS